MIRKITCLLVVVVCATTIIAMNQPPRDKKKGLLHSLAQSMMERKMKEFEYRLPCHIRPHVYIFDLDPDFLGEKFIFNGNATILFEILKPMTTVTLHKSDRMNIEKQATTLINENGDIKKPISQKWSNINEFFSMKFNTKLEVGNYTLKMSWTGRDGGDNWYQPLSGFYRAVDKNNNGELKYLITTHFEPDAARQVFPCWDEPGMKAQFEISIKHYPNYTALSNMPVENHEELPDGKIRTRFERSPKMSPYLPCLAVAHYKYIESTQRNIRFYSLERALDSIRYALEVSEMAIPALESYTDVPYAFPKLDQITIPQYGATAMEHWGLVSYVTSSVTIRNTTFLPNINKREHVEFVVAHELSHQWFGNLVTPKWWDDAWLNEAFAAYFQYKALDLMFPEHKVMEDFVVEHLNQQAFEAERDLDNTKPIKWNPTTKIEIRRMFSQITYAKGSGILHMLDHMLGQEIFRDGIQRYLKTHQFTAVVTDNLWDSLQEAYDKKNIGKPLNVKETMDPWIKQTGYPVVTVTRNNETGDVILTQKNAMPVNTNNKWKIPLNYATKSNPDFSSTLPTLWFNENDDNVTIPNINKEDWIIFNIEQNGFYLVDYDEENWRLIADHLDSENFTDISPINRAQLITDAFRMVQDTKYSDRKRLEILINITSYLHREKNYLPWIPAAEVMNVFNKVMRNTAAEEVVNKYMLFLLREMLDHIGEDYTSLKARQLLFPIACKLEHAECQEYAAKIFRENLDTLTLEILNEYDNDWIICAGLGQSNETVWDSFFKFFVNARHYMRPYEFLKCSKSIPIRDKYMDRIFTTNITDDPSDIAAVFRQFKNSKVNVDYILQYFISHFESIQKYFEESGDNESVMVIAAVLCEAVGTTEQYEKLGDFLKSHIEDPRGEFAHLDTIEAKKSIVEELLNQFHAVMDKRLIALNIIQPNERDTPL